MDDTNEPSERLHPRAVGMFTLRDVVVALVCLIGGAGAGGGATFWGGSGMKDEMARLVAKVDALTNAVSLMASDNRGIEREHSIFNMVNSDHESRIRKLEELRRQ